MSIPIFPEASARSLPEVMLYLSKTSLRRCPEICIEIFSETPSLTIFLTAVLRKSWNNISEHPAAFVAASHAVRKSFIGRPVLPKKTWAIIIPRCFSMAAFLFCCVTRTSRMSLLFAKLTSRAFLFWWILVLTGSFDVAVDLMPLQRKQFTFAPAVDITECGGTSQIIWEVITD
jgi:hypothetical protein